MEVRAGAHGGASKTSVWSGAGGSACTLRGVQRTAIRDRRVPRSRPMPGPAGARGGLCHESACGRYPWLSGAFAPTQEEHKPEAQAKINTDVTRTKRHSPAYGGTRSTMTVTENSASLPAEMRVSWADYSFPGWWARGDRPSEKRKVDSSILSLTTSPNEGAYGSEQGKRELLR
jgi:hypothetical protein